VSERNDPQRQRLSWFWEQVRRLCYRRADLLTANTAAAVDYFRGVLPEERRACIANAVSVPVQSDTATREPWLLIVARLVPQKGHRHLFEAFARLHQRFPEWRLRVVGDGPEGQRLRDLADHLGIAGAVEWPGAVRNPHEDYARSSIFVLPSEYEGLPNALLEAAAHGLPTVVSDASPGLRELVDDGRSGFVVRVEKCDAFAEALQRLMADADLRRRFGARAREIANRYSPENIYAEWDERLRQEVERCDTPRTR